MNNDTATMMVIIELRQRIAYLEGMLTELQQKQEEQQGEATVAP